MNYPTGYVCKRPCASSTSQSPCATPRTNQKLLICILSFPFPFYDQQIYTNEPTLVLLKKCSECSSFYSLNAVLLSGSTKLKSTKALTRLKGLPTFKNQCSVQVISQNSIILMLDNLSQKRTTEQQQRSCSWESKFHRSLDWPLHVAHCLLLNPVLYHQCLFTLFFVHQICALESLLKSIELIINKKVYMIGWTLSPASFW